MQVNGYRALAARLQEQGNILRQTWLNPEKLGQAALLADTAPQDAHGFPHEMHTESGDFVLCERFSRDQILLLCGGGHVSRPVSALGKLLGYRVIVLDDRAEFADPARFPDADEVQCTDFTAALRSYDWKRFPNTSVIIVTRGHVADTSCLREVVRRELPYIGMIGSRKKNHAVFDLLRSEGVTEAQLAQVHAPIGLPIGGRTPEEIAVSIAAELVQTRQKDAKTVFSKAMLDALLDESCTGGIMATIVRKSGSAPRGVGARMLLLPNGEVRGTIGGGLAEHQAIQTMRELLLAPRPLLTHINMANGEAGKSGLICGGTVEVLFEVID